MRTILFGKPDRLLEYPVDTHLHQGIVPHSSVVGQVEPEDHFGVLRSEQVGREKQFEFDRDGLNSLT